MVARSPKAIASRLNMSFENRPPVTTFPDSTPIDPVKVPGRATIHRPGIETQ